jgi:hypothetical protein
MTTAKSAKSTKLKKTVDAEATAQAASETNEPAASRDSETGMEPMESLDSVEAAQAADSAGNADAEVEKTFEIVTAWPALTPEDASAVSEFWRREGAINDATDAARRLTQVVLFARTASGEIAGVCTAVAKLPMRLRQPMYYWRTFSGKAWRTTHPHLPMTLLKRSCAVLEAYARERDFPCIGVMLELENDRFRQILRKPVWWNPPFCYAGKSPRGLDVRVLYFKGARLKSPAELQKLGMPIG